MKWIFGGIIGCSLAMNLYMGQQISKMKELQQIGYQKDTLISNGYDELLVSYLNEVRNTNLEVLKTQGRLEGILSVALNFKPEENQHTAIWHAGYDHGSKTADYVRSVAYKQGYHKACEDLNCPAKGEFEEQESKEERREKIERLKKELDIFDNSEAKNTKVDKVAEK